MRYTFARMKKKDKDESYRTATAVWAYHRKIWKGHVDVLYEITN